MGRRVAWIGLLLAGVAWGQVPPGQPETGPAGTQYRHGGIEAYHFLDLAVGHYRIYQPVEPRPESAPVLLYLAGVSGSGGYGGLAEFDYFGDAYHEMFRHLTRKGYIVVLAGYGFFGNPLIGHAEYAIAAARLALDRLDAEEQFVSMTPGAFAVAGHSYGGLLATQIAARWQEWNLPRPRALITHETALIAQLVESCAQDPESPFCGLDFVSSFGAIHPDTVNVAVVGDPARPAALGLTVEQWWLPQVPADRQNLLYIHDDGRYAPGLSALHLSVLAHPTELLPGLQLDAIDWYGYWKPTTAALEFTFRGTDGEYVFGDRPEVRNMGEWSDGTPVARMSVATDIVNGELVESPDPPKLRRRRPDR